MRQTMRPLMQSTAVAISAAWLLAVPAANAQTPSTQTPSGQVPSAQTQNIPDQKLDAAAAAVEQVANVKKDYQQRIEAAPTPDKQRIADEANKVLAKTVTDHGLTVEEYTSILVAAKDDPGVRDKLIQRMNPPGKQ